MSNKVLTRSKGKPHETNLHSVSVNTKIKKTDNKEKTSRNTSIINIKYDSDDNTSPIKETTQEIIINLRNKLAEKSYDFIRLEEENLVLKGEISKSNQELINKEKIISEQRQMIDKFISSKNIYVSVATQTDGETANSIISTPCQTEIIRTEIRSTQTEKIVAASNENQANKNAIKIHIPQNEREFKNYATKSLVKSTLEKRQKKRSKLLFVAGRHGINCGSKLNELLGDKYQVFSVVKPNANNIELLRTCKTEARNFTSRDVLIVWLKSYNFTNDKILDSFTSSFGYANLIFITEPYVYNICPASRRNDDIHNFNLSLINKFLETTTQIKVFDCNSFLKHNHFLNFTDNLKENAKYKICKNLSKLIKTNGINNIASTRRNTLNEKNVCSNNSNIEDTENIGIRNDKSLPIPTTKRSNPDHSTVQQQSRNFLYPSQTQLTLLPYLQTGKLQPANYVSSI